jgi:uncharacterized coiled-coil protein SlyX
MTSDQDRLLAEIYRKIDREKVLMHGASQMQRISDNPEVQSRVDTKIREARKNIEYLEDRLRTLQQQMQPSGPTPPPHGSQGYYPQQSERQNVPDSGPPLPPKDPNIRSYRGEQQTEYGDHRPPAGYGAGKTVTMPTRAPFSDPQPFQAVPKARPNFSKLGGNSFVSLFSILGSPSLDLIKYDTPYRGPKIQLMLSQLEFKLSVEKQYKAGIEKMVRLYQMNDGDRRSRQDAEARLVESRRVESNQKIRLLEQALKGYADLHVGVAEDDAGDGRGYHIGRAPSGDIAC